MSTVRFSRLALNVSGGIELNYSHIPFEDELFQTTVQPVFDGFERLLCKLWYLDVSGPNILKHLAWRLSWQYRLRQHCVLANSIRLFLSLRLGRYASRQALCI